MRNLLAGLFVCVLGATVFASPPLPDTRSGPIGWEKAIAPGFDPPIEYVVVFGTEWLDRYPSIEECAAKWGPGAVPVLVRLYRDPGWAPFQEKILTAIGAFTAPEAKDFLLKEYTDARALSNPKPEIQNKISRFLGLIRKMDPERADQLVEEGLKDPSSSHFSTYVYDLMNRASRPENAAAKERLEQLLKSLPENNAVRTSIMTSRERDKAVQRANEPMSVVLDKERGGKR